MKLIDECREEEERLSIMYEDDNKSQIYTEKGQMQLAKFDHTNQKLSDAHNKILELEDIKKQYEQSVEDMNQREANI